MPLEMIGFVYFNFKVKARISRPEFRLEEIFKVLAFNDIPCLRGLKNVEDHGVMIAELKECLRDQE